MEQVKLIIEMKGGQMQSLYSNTTLDYLIINHDEKDRGKSPLSEIQHPDIVYPLLHELYDTDTPSGLEIRDELKRLKF